jgi:septum formation protein
VSLFLFMNKSLLTTKKIILASHSPRRQQLLRQIGLEFDVRGNTSDEVIDETKTPKDIVLSLSQQKAFEVSKTVTEGIVLGFDTIVVIDGTILGKPKGANEAKKMLNLLSGRKHEVYTGFTIVEKPEGRTVSDFEKTVVTFRTLEQEEIVRYVDSGSPLDKAGAYGIQDDMGAVFVERINGCFYNVVGLPLTKLYVTLKNFLRQSDG